MKIMLDCSPKKIAEYDEKYSHDFWQLRTPLTQYALSGKPYGLDNGCFSGFKHESWNQLVKEAKTAPPKFITLPDVVGSARLTLQLFAHFKPLIPPELPVALVLQDGIQDFDIPFNDLQCLFIGGSTEFKSSPFCAHAVAAGRILGKWIHVGRVNTTARAKGWMGIGDSLDGSGISRFDDRLHEVLSVIQASEKQERLF